MRSSKLVGLLVAAILAALAPMLLTGSPAAAEEVTMPGGVVPVSPFRALDTRTGTGAPKAVVAKGGSVTFSLLGKGDIPSEGVGGVFLNVTATGATGGGYVTAYPAGTSVPDASNLSVKAGQTIPNMVFVPVGSGANDGKVSLYNGTTGTINLIADTAGYVLAGTATEPGAAVPVAPFRALDTRNGVGAPKAPVAANAFVEVQLGGVGGVPASGASGVWLNVTVTQPTKPGYIAASPGGVASSSSNLNFLAGQTIPNMVFVPLSASGKVRLLNGSAGTSQLIVDIAGYVRDGETAAPGTAAPVSPVRILDTRSGNGAPKAAVAAGASITLQVTGRGNIPAASGVAGVFLNVTVTQPTKPGYVTAYPGLTAAGSSNLNFVAGQTIPNMVFVPVNNAGQIRLKNGTAGTLHLLADTAGFVRKASAPSLLTTLASVENPYSLDTSTHGEAVVWTDSTCVGEECRRIPARTADRGTSPSASERKAAPRTRAAKRALLQSTADAADTVYTERINYVDRATQTQRQVVSVENDFNSSTWAFLDSGRIGGPGRWVVYQLDTGDDETETYTSTLKLWDATTGTTTDVPNPQDIDLMGYDISGDGTWIIFSGWTGEGAGGIWAWNRTTPATAPVAVLAPGADSPDVASVSADGSWITFSNYRCLDEECTEDSSTLETIGRSGGQRAVIFTDTGAVAADWASSRITADGQRVVFSTYLDEESFVSVVRLWQRGVGQSPVTPESPDVAAWSPSISDDGAWITYSLDVGDEYGVYLRNRTTGTEHLVDANSDSPVLSGDGEYVALAHWADVTADIAIWGPNPY